MKKIFYFVLPLLQVLFDLYALFLRFLRVMNLIKPIEKSALILPPAAPGSLGDEAMVVATYNFLRNQGVKNITIIQYNMKQKYPVACDDLIDMRNYFVFSSFFDWFNCLFAFGLKMAQYEKIYLLGADLMDGFYSDYVTFKIVQLMDMAAKSGLESSILGFSFNDKPTPTVINLLKRLSPKVKLYARDSVSYERLISIINHPVNLVADLAFLLEKETNSDNLSSLITWINEEKKSKLLIGINANSLFIEKIDNITKEDLIQAYINLINNLLNHYKNVGFIFLPHDFRPLKNSRVSDFSLAEEILKNLDQNTQQICQIVPKTIKASQMKYLVSKLDFVVSSRMHLAIACLGVNTPVLTITYQGKFAGLFKHFEIDNLTLTIDDLLKNSPEVINCYYNAIDSRDMIAQKIATNLPKVRELSEKNFV